MLKSIFKTPITENYFQGYFDQRTISSCSNYALACKADFTSRLPQKNDSLKIGYFDILEGKFNLLSSTLSWNWQQGPKLQFLDNDVIVFNNVSPSDYKSEFFNLDGNKVAEDYPIYTISKSGEVFISLNFKRHYFYKRGYSYSYHIEEAQKSSSAEFLRLHAHNRCETITSQQILESLGKPVLRDSIVLLEHPQLNPVGSHSLFMLRVYLDGYCHSSLCLFDVDSMTTRLLLDSGRVSHYNWVSNTAFVYYGASLNAVNNYHLNMNKSSISYKLLKKMYKQLIPVHSRLRHKITGDNYYHYDLETNKNIKLNSDIYEDGHPSMCPETGIFITDSYPQNGVRKLYVKDKKNKSMTLEVESNALTDETPLRCDLHPKYDNTTKTISIDTFRQHRGFEIFKITL